MIKILHGADFHLDSPFEALPEEKAMQRRAEQRTLLERLAELANSERVDAVILSGDLLDSDRSYYETGEVLVRAFGEIRAPVFIAPGNHDYYYKYAPWAALKLPENVHVFKTPTPEAVELPNGKGVIWGAAFTASKSRGLLENFEGIQRGATIHIMALHGQVVGGASEEGYGPITKEQIEASGLNYLALGHEHSYSGLQKAGDTYYAYPGCPEGRGFDECGERGVLIAEVSRTIVKERFVPLSGRQYQRLAVDLEDQPNVGAAIERALPEKTQRDIYRIALTGEFEGDLNLAELTEAFQNRFFHLTIRDETRIRRDIWESKEEDTLRGLFLRKMYARYEAGDPRERERVTWAIRYALNAMENSEQWRV